MTDSGIGRFGAPIRESVEPLLPRFETALVPRNSISGRALVAVVAIMKEGNRQNLLRARHIEIHGRLAEGSVTSNPVIEIALQLDQASAPDLYPAAAKPMDANVTTMAALIGGASPEIKENVDCELLG